MDKSLKSEIFRSQAFISRIKWCLQKQISYGYKIAAHFYLTRRCRLLGANMIIVTGGAGFIGSAVIWMLNNKGFDDILVVDHLGASSKWKNLVNRKYRDYIHKSAFLTGLEKHHFDGVDTIIHLGACSSTTESDADYLMENNFHYSVTLATHALANNIRFINASSAATYGNGSQGFIDNCDTLDRLKPLNMYGYTKHLFDLWAERSGAMKNLASLKFFNVFGPNEYHKGDMSSLAYKGFYQIREKGFLRLFKSTHQDYEDGGQRRDFVYVKDCAAIIGWLFENPSITGLFNVGSGKDHSWNDLAEALFSATNRPPKIEYIDMPEQIRKNYQNFTKADPKKLKEAGCPIQCTKLVDAVSDYVVNYLQKEDPYL
jgi:ADP-L-glycero-D-manno-heptose 6-epimerase